MDSTNLNYGNTEILIIDDKGYFNDGLAIVLTSFSHKRPFTGGPTKATAYITISKDGVSEIITLSAHGTDGKPDHEKYDTLVWKEYELKLKAFDYNKSIELIVDKTK